MSELQLKMIIVPWLCSFNTLTKKSKNFLHIVIEYKQQHRASSCTFNNELAQKQQKQFKQKLKVLR